MKINRKISLWCLSAFLCVFAEQSHAESSCTVDGKDSSVTYTGNWWDSNDYTLQTDPLGGTYSVGSVSSAIHAGRTRLGNGSDYQSGSANFPNCFSVNNDKYYQVTITYITSNDYQYERSADVPVTIYHLDETGQSTSTVVSVDMSDNSAILRKNQNLGNFKAVSAVAVSNAPSDGDYVTPDVIRFAEVEGGGGSGGTSNTVGGVIDADGTIIEGYGIESVSYVSTGTKEVCIDPNLGWQPPFLVTVTGYVSYAIGPVVRYTDVSADNCFKVLTVTVNGQWANAGFSLEVKNFE